MYDHTAVVNPIRGLLREYGVFLAQGIHEVRRRVPEVLEDADNELTSLTREIVAELYKRLREFDHSIKHYQLRIEGICRDSETCQRLVLVEGVGPLMATALVAAVGDA